MMTSHFAPQATSRGPGWATWILLLLQFPVFGVPAILVGIMRFHMLVNQQDRWPSVVLLMAAVLLSIACAAAAVLVVRRAPWRRRIIAAVIVIAGAVISGFALLPVLYLPRLEMLTMHLPMLLIAPVGAGVLLGAVLLAISVACGWHWLVHIIAFGGGLLIPLAVKGVAAPWFIGYFTASVGSTSGSIVYIVTMMVGAAAMLALLQAVGPRLSAAQGLAQQPVRPVQVPAPGPAQQQVQPVPPAQPVPPRPAQGPAQAVAGGPGAGR